MIKYKHKLRTNESNKNKNSNALTSSRKKGGREFDFNRDVPKGLYNIGKVGQIAATYIGRGLSPEEFNEHYAKEIANKIKVDKNFRLTPEQMERLTRRNSIVIFNKLSSIPNSGDIRIDGIQYGCETKDVWGTLTTTANFVWQDKTSQWEWLAYMQNFFPAEYNGKNTYLIQDAKDMRPPGIPGVQLPKYCYMLLPPENYDVVRGISRQKGGIRRTRHNRKYKNQTTKKCNQKTKKCRKQKSRRTRRR